MSKEREKALEAWWRPQKLSTTPADTFRAGWDAAEKYFVVVSNRAFAAEKREAAQADEMERLRTEVEAHRAAASVFSVSEKDWKALALGAERERERDEARAALSVAREVLERLYRFPGVRELLAPVESLGSIAAEVEAALAPQPSTVEPPKNPLALCSRYACHHQRQDHGDSDLQGERCTQCDCPVFLGDKSPLRAPTQEPAKPTVEPAREHGGHPSTCPACAAKPTAEEKPTEMERRARTLWDANGKLAAEVVEQVRRAEAAEKSLETANGLLERVARDLDRGAEPDECIVEYIRAFLALPSPAEEGFTKCDHCRNERENELDGGCQLVCGLCLDAIGMRGEAGGWNEAVEACAKFAEGGRFSRMDKLDEQWGRECAAGIRRLRRDTSKPEEKR